MLQETPHLLRWGKHGPTLVFLHYFGGSADSWQWVTRQLQSEFQCIALNLPGFGSTQPLSQLGIRDFAQWIANTLTQAGIDKCTLIGHSMSGKLALAVAAEYTDLLERVILLAPSPPTREPMPEEEKERMLNHPDRKEAEQTVHNATIQPLSDDQSTLTVDTQLAIDPATWRWWLMEGMNESIAEHMPSVKIPVSIIASQDDPAIPYSTVENELLEFLPSAQLISTDQVSHLIPLESPEWLAHEIRLIIDKHRQGSTHPSDIAPD